MTATAAATTRDALISADSHVRAAAPRFARPDPSSAQDAFDEYAGHIDTFFGRTRRASSHTEAADKATKEARIFDAEVRMRELANDGVVAEIMHPNVSVSIPFSPQPLDHLGRGAPVARAPGDLVRAKKGQGQEGAGDGADPEHRRARLGGGAGQEVAATRTRTAAVGAQRSATRSALRELRGVGRPPLHRVTPGAQGGDRLPSRDRVGDALGDVAQRGVDPLAGQLHQLSVSARLPD
jgi:hypothetical protein